MHEPAISHDPHWSAVPWQIHCETARTHEEHTENVPAAEGKDWVFARDANGEPYTFEGEPVDGFLEVTAVNSPASRDLPPDRMEVRSLCLQTIERLDSDIPLMLGWVMAARPGEEINLPPVYPDETHEAGGVSRVVIFGDSLTDTGRLKNRLRIFPSSPYWIGRFSNGPAWPEYLAMATGMGVQNHSYGGASAAEHDTLPGANIYARTREVGQFFVSGTIDLQLEDYLERTLAHGRVERPEATAYLIWAGANDYISKEPVTGLITTFLNSPEGESGYRTVVQRTVTEIENYVRTLYDAGARYFVIINLPDLGRTPIVLQNKTYLTESPRENDDARKLELARRLSQLTAYHNRLLGESLDRLRAELPQSHILLVDAFQFFRELQGDHVDASTPLVHGHDLDALETVLEHGGERHAIQQGCYSGSYLGSNDPGEICAEPEKALFWDTVHPTTLTHCWQAWKVGEDMARAGWIAPLPEGDVYREWCQTIVERVALESVGHFGPAPVKEVRCSCREKENE